MTNSLESRLLQQAGFFHGFSLRPLDLQLESEGAASALSLFGSEIGIDSRDVRQARQVHGSAVVDAESVGSPLPEADVLTAKFPLAVGVRVADCVPVLLAHTESGNVAAIHAGWRGLVAGAVEAGVRALSPGGDREALVAAIGPSIGPCCFEVGEDVAHALGQASGSDAVLHRDAPKPHVDLRAVAERILAREGVRRVERVGNCTFCNARSYFSFRRDGALAGRHLALIAARAAASRR